MDTLRQDQDILNRISESVETVSRLRDYHREIDQGISNEDNEDERFIMRVHEVKRALDELDLSVDEGRLVTAIADLIEVVESDQAQNELDLIRIKDDNDWLREELEEAENKLEDVLSRIAALEIEKQHHLFMLEVQYTRCPKPMKKKQLIRFSWDKVNMKIFSTINSGKFSMFVNLFNVDRW